MTTPLFFPDGLPGGVDVAGLFRSAWPILTQEQLLKKCARGEHEDVCALLSGYWPLISEIEVAIIPHIKQLGDVRHHFAHAIVKGVIESLQLMSQDEAGHAGLWDRSMDLMEIRRRLTIDEALSKIRKLIGQLRGLRGEEFFAQLAGVELTAIIISMFLWRSPEFNAHFGKDGWPWALPHLLDIPDADMHDDAKLTEVLLWERGHPSHLHLDLQLAAACYLAKGRDADFFKTWLERFVLGTVYQYAGGLWTIHKQKIYLKEMGAFK